jgi:hypothetical protein
MEIRTYYVLRLEGGEEEYGPRTGNEDDAWMEADTDHERLVVFTDHEEALAQAKREGEGTVVEPRSGAELNALAREGGFNFILVLEKDGGRSLVNLED